MASAEVITFRFIYSTIIGYDREGTASRGSLRCHDILRRQKGKQEGKTKKRTVGILREMKCGQ